MSDSIGKTLIEASVHIESALQSITRDVERIEEAWKRYEKDASLHLTRRHLGQLLMRFDTTLRAAIVNRVAALLRAPQASLGSSIPSDISIDRIGAHDVAVLIRAEQAHDAQVLRRTA